MHAFWASNDLAFDDLPKVLYEHMNPMTYASACEMEVLYAEQLKRRGFNVHGGH